MCEQCAGDRTLWNLFKEQPSVKTEEALLVKGLLVSESWDLETSRTSTRSGKEEPKKNDGLLATHRIDSTPLFGAVNGAA
jgi:hypothetical protein